MYNKDVPIDRLCILKFKDEYHVFPGSTYISYAYPPKSLAKVFKFEYQAKDFAMEEVSRAETPMRIEVISLEEINRALMKKNARLIKQKRYENRSR